MKKVILTIVLVLFVSIAYGQTKTCIITPDTKFTNTKIDKYWISYKDGNLYYQKLVSRGWYAGSERYNNVLILKNVKTIYGSGTYFAIQNDGNLWAWGNNEYGQVGDNSGINRDSPVKILDNVKDVTIHEGYVFAVKNDGTVYAWGGSGYARKENAGFAPEKVSIENVSYVYAVGNTVSAVTLSGEIYQWLTYDRKPPQKAPYKGKKPFFAKRQPIVSKDDVAAKQYNSHRGSYITPNGDLYSWGDVTGNGTNIPVPQNSPVFVLSNVKQICLGNAGWSGSKTYRYALCADGKLYTVDIEKTFKYVQVASNVYLLNTSDNYNVERGTVSYYTNDGCIYQLSYGGTPKRTDYDVALPKIKLNDTDIIEYSPDGYIQDIGKYLGISDVSVLIIGAVIIAIFIILLILFPKFRKILLLILGIIAGVAFIVAAAYVLIFVIAIVIVLFWLLSGGLGRQWNRDH